MYTVTTLGYGYMCAAHVVDALSDKDCFTRTCKTCGQAPYFFGVTLGEVSSKKFYNTIHDMSGVAAEHKRSLMERYADILGVEIWQVDEPQFLMFTDIKR